MALTRMISVAVLFSLFLSFPAVAVDNSETPKIAGLPAEVQYPFMAKVTGNDVNVRSGKGTAYYACGKVNLDDQVTVVGEGFGWAEIIPPEGSYSWIHKNYVDVEDDQPTVGVLTGDNVRVWAGSDNIEPMRSSSMQTKLNTGEIIELFADQPTDGDYYKIKPPAGAKLTINCGLLEYVGPAASPKPVAIPPRTAAEKPVDLPASPETEAPFFGNLTEEKTPEEIQADPADEPGAGQGAEKAEP
ncbi:MAG: SH3 domain-containing protein, partial [Planctomycetota bacterium]